MGLFSVDSDHLPEAVVFMLLVFCVINIQY